MAYLMADDADGADARLARGARVALELQAHAHSREIAPASCLHERRLTRQQMRIGIRAPPPPAGLTVVARSDWPEEPGRALRQRPWTKAC